MTAIRCLLLAAAVALPALAIPAGADAARGAAKLDGAYIVMLEGSAGDPDRTVDELQRRRGFRARLRFRRAMRGFAARLTDRQVADLREDPAVASVTPDRPVEALGEVRLKAGDSVPTGVRRMGAGGTGTAREASDAKVAVIDSGIDLAHPDLNAVDGVNCVTPGAPARDDDGHGTHVAGTVAAKNDGSGVVGVAPGTRAVAVKVLNGEGRGSFSQVICGIDWVTATRTDADPSNDIALANLSLGGTGNPVASCARTNDPLHRAICASTRAGVTYVVAAGNDAWDFDRPDAPDLPASYPEVIAVTAMSDSDGAAGGGGGTPACRPGEADDTTAGFSNYAVTATGAGHTVAAPGVCIRSTWPGGGYSTISGTSMAAPHVAGAVALCLGEGGAAGPCAGLSPAAIVARTRETAAIRDAGYGFAGDPFRPIAGRYFGHLAWAGQAAAGDVPPAPIDPGPAPVTPTPTPVTPTPPAAPVAAAPRPAPAVRPPLDTTAPLAFLSVSRQRLGSVLGKGLLAGLRCSERCVARAELWLPGRTARRLRLSRGASARIGHRAPVVLAAGARRNVRLKLSGTARRSLARLGAATLLVKLTVTDGRNRRTISRGVSVRR